MAVSSHVGFHPDTAVSLLLHWRRFQAVEGLQGRALRLR